MEADWAVEIGPDAPSIDVPWEGFVYLRNHSSGAIQMVPEAAGHPALFNALFALNSQNSPVFTSKCDLWTMDQEEIDVYEFAARPETARRGFASYLDVLLLDQEKYQSFEFHQCWVRLITEQLHSRTLASCRVDLVVRAATVHSECGYGLTIYAAGYGEGEQAAYVRWEAVLMAAAHATMSVACSLPEWAPAG